MRYGPLSFYETLRSQRALIIQILNLSGVTALRSFNLEGLLADDIDAAESPLRVLSLNNTSIDDSAAPYISTCRSLETLEVGGTRLTGKM